MAWVGIETENILFCILFQLIHNPSFQVNENALRNKRDFNPT
jgi:hypothetical protein